LPDLLKVIARHWGFRGLRPLQEQAMSAVLDGRDSLVVLPTGGGKSLCYQAPAVYRGGTTLVVSPLIALMKDQVDALRSLGIAAAQLDSSLSSVEHRAYYNDLQQGAIRLLFVSPERLVQSDLYRVLQRLGVRTFAIDEAHCISHWGHDFRPEYRQLSLLREHFPDASVHAYTATATEQVRRDIATQLALRDPVVLVGNFDRANLTYRVLPRLDLMRQVNEVLERHRGEAGIVYCLRRKDVDDLSAALKLQGVAALPYHAGMTAEDRQATQEAFTAERCDVVVATVAFGMGIDRSNVRFVLHTALPKSLEHYQQETGRAGRDGLEAECVLLFSGADLLTFKFMIEKSASENAVDPSFVPSALKHLDEMDRYCRGAVCRHRALVEYFGQKYETPSCDACDLCLGDTQEVPEAVVVAQKILSCVARVKEGFGIGHVVAVLRGKNTENVRKRGHDKLSTFGLLHKHSDADLRDWVYQLIGQGVLLQVGTEYPLLKLNAASWDVMRGQHTVRLVQLARRRKGERPERSRAAANSWEGVDQGLFDVLKALRYRLAGERQEAPYMIFGDTVLRDLARVRPSTPERMRQLSGVGDVKLRNFGGHFLPAIAEHCRKHGLAMDVSVPSGAATLFHEPAPSAPARVNPRQVIAFDLFRKGTAIDDAMKQMDLKRSTVQGYLAEYICAERPASISRWLPDALYHRIAAAVRQAGTERLKPIFLLLGEKVAYDDIRLVIAHLQARGSAEDPAAE
jgi:ATP-dependent DNA helicase RecQ